VTPAQESGPELLRGASWHQVLLGRDLFGLSGYRLLLFITSLVFALLLVLNALSSAEAVRRMVAVVALGSAIAASVAGLVRSLRDPNLVLIDAPRIAWFGMSVYIGMVWVVGAPSLAFGPFALLASYIAAPLKAARIQAGFYLLTALLAVAFYAETPFLLRHLLAMAGMWALVEFIAHRLGEAAAELRASVAQREASAQATTDSLERQVAERSQALERSREALIETILSLSARRSVDLGERGLRLRALTRALAWRYASDRPSVGLTQSWIDELVRAAPLHDVGRLALPEAVRLRAVGVGEQVSIEAMALQSLAGRDVLERALALSVADEVPFLRIAQRMVEHLHERWDGRGHPRGLAAESIPLEARLMALVQFFLGLTQGSSYTRPMTQEEALRVLTLESGHRFDPALVSAFEPALRAIDDEVVAGEAEHSVGSSL
jgi:response regulator RpfG family c-di-GMP phosphodiesterase